MSTPSSSAHGPRKSAAMRTWSAAAPRARGRARTGEAEPLSRHALDLRRASAPEEVPTSLHSLGRLHHMRGQYPEAVKLFREALRQQLAAPQPSAMTIATTEFNLGWALLEMEQ